MRILPTYADIRRNAAETLPPTNFNHSCSHEGIERLLDVQFRLLRHDCLGALEKQLKKITRALRNNPEFEFKSSEYSEADKTDYFIFEDVHVQKLLFNRSHGLETQLLL
jgi:hypothetical protein